MFLSQTIGDAEDQQPGGGRHVECPAASPKVHVLPYILRTDIDCILLACQAVLPPTCTLHAAPSTHNATRRGLLQTNEPTVSALPPPLHTISPVLTR